ncbi:MAG: RNA methyltransferase [Bdellovibrionaceae bacterium]|nr:RNA methyltransferase [Pseudobdellovibrionaceae bacterium]
MSDGTQAVQVPRVAVGLLHYPMMDREKSTVATNITNFDIHDIARACSTYGITTYYVIHPSKEQLMFVERVLEHWKVGTGAKYNPSRRRALQPVKTAPSLEAALADWGPSTVVATHARPVPGTKFWTCQEYKQHVREPGQSGFIVFGTGYGMTDEYMQGIGGVLESLKGAPPQDFRHLSVRSAVSIYLDRIMGPW